MHKLSKLHNSKCKSIRDIAWLISDRDGLYKGLSSDDVHELLELLVEYEQKEVE